MEWVFVILVVLALAAGFYFVRRAQRKVQVHKPTHAKPESDIPKRRAGTKAGVPTVAPASVDPAPSSVPPGGVSATRSRFYVVADRPVNSPGGVEATAGEYGFKVGESMTFVVEARDDAGKPVASVPVRGIIDLSTGSQMPTVPKTGATGPDGSFRARYTMRQNDELPGAAKLVTASLVVGNSTVQLKPYPLADTVNTVDNLDDPFFRGE